MPHIITGITSFDEEVLGVGGVPRGRVVEIYGPESSGKTTLVLEIIAAAQRNGELAAFVDAEHALDPNYASQLGVDVDNLYVSQPDYGEQALEAVIALVESRAVTIVAVDSVAALVPKAELDGEMGDSHMGLQARLMSQAMRKLVGICAVNEVTVIFINQLREKIGVVFGNPETTTGGRALKFYSSVRLDVRRDANGNIKDGDKIIGHRLKIKAAKNKVATPFRETVVNLIYGQGIDRKADLITYGESLGVVEKSGAWYNYKGERLGNGLEKAKTSITPDLAAAISADILAALETKKESNI
jgi:recombination protein RecA